MLQIIFYSNVFCVSRIVWLEDGIWLLIFSNHSYSSDHHFLPRRSISKVIVCTNNDNDKRTDRIEKLFFSDSERHETWKFVASYTISCNTKWEVRTLHIEKCVQSSIFPMTLKINIPTQFLRLSGICHFTCTFRCS